MGVEPNFFFIYYFDFKKKKKKGWTNLFKNMVWYFPNILLFLVRGLRNTFFFGTGIPQTRTKRIKKKKRENFLKTGFLFFLFYFKLVNFSSLECVFFQNIINFLSFSFDFRSITIAFFNRNISFFFFKIKNKEAVWKKKQLCCS